MMPWAGATVTQRNNIIENIARHELGHMFGHGHAPTSGTTLMNDGGGGTVDTFWTTLKTFTAAENSMLDCYKETSGTTPNC